MSPLKNYTTEIAAERSLHQIQQKLVNHGARSIRVDYSSGGEPASLSFMVVTKEGELPFRLPANVAKVQVVLMRESTPGYRRQGQAARVAWRILKDWVDAQLAIIETEMVTLQEVFLPYMIVKGTKLTVFELMSSQGYLLKAGNPEGESR